MAQEKNEITKALKNLEKATLDPVAEAVANLKKSSMAALYGYSASRVAFDEGYPAPKVEEDEEWVWVRGFKGTDRDMCCRGYQYGFEGQFDMPEDERIELCYRGFHFCHDLKDVFQYYRIGDGNRFFAVEALVRKDDADKIGTMFELDKFVAKSIIFVDELTTDEILEASYVDTSYWSAEDKEAAREEGCSVVLRRIQIGSLTSLGYSKSMADYIIDRNRFQLAQILGLQPDISMDTRILILFNGN